MRRPDFPFPRHSAMSAARRSEPACEVREKVVRGRAFQRGAMPVIPSNPEARPTVEPERAIPRVTPLGVYVAARSQFHFSTWMVVRRPSDLIDILFVELPLAEHGWVESRTKVSHIRGSIYLAERGRKAGET